MVNEHSALPSSLERMASSLFRLSRAFRSAAQRRSVHGTRLRRGDLGLLRVLAESGPQRPGAVADQLGVGPSVVSRQLAPLLADGLITRRADPADGRAEIVEITPAGRQCVVELMREYVTHFASKFEHWDVARVEAAADLIDELIDAVNQVANPVVAPSERPAS